MLRLPGRELEEYLSTLKAVAVRTKTPTCAGKVLATWWSGYWQLSCFVAAPSAVVRCS